MTGESTLREIFLKTDNYQGGLYFAQLIKVQSYSIGGCSEHMYVTCCLQEVMYVTCCLREVMYVCYMLSSGSDVRMLHVVFGK